MAYRGPNVEVIQNFVATPAQATVEDLPVGIAGSVFLVREKAIVGEFAGAGWQSVASPVLEFDEAAADTVIYSASQNQRVYDRFPITFFTGKAGDYELVRSTSEVSESGVTMKFGRTWATTDKYLVSENVNVLKTWIPIYSKTGGDVFTYTAATRTVTVPGALLQDSHGIVAGLPVYARITGSTYFLLGTIESVNNNESFVITDTVPGGFTPATDCDEIYIGYNPDDTTPTTSENYAAYMYSVNGDFEALEAGDVVEIVTASGLTGTIRPASIQQKINKNLIQLHVMAGISGEVNEGEIDNTGLATLRKQDFNKLFGGIAKTTTKTMVTAYNVYKLVGFTKKLAGTAATGDGVTKVLTLGGAISPALKAGDIVVTYDGAAPTVALDRLVVESGSGTEYNMSGIVSASTDGVVIWRTGATQLGNIINNVYASYRVATQLDQVGLIQDSDSNYPGGSDTNVHLNDLRQMADIQKLKAPNRKFYYAVIDPTAAPTTAYAEALEGFGLKDIYDIALGSDEVAVQALLPGHMDSQSDPYEAHERICVQNFNELDVYGISVHTGTVSDAGAVDCGSGVDFIAEGLGIGDEVVFDATVTATGVIEKITAKVTGSITAIGTVATDFDGTDYDAVTSRTLTFLAGTNAKKAQKATAFLGAADNRRVTAIFPSSFLAKIDNTMVELPSFYLAAAIVGLDASTSPAQSQTNYKHQLPWVVQLDTNFKFKKSELDTIASEGVYVFCSPDFQSQTVYSRHDLTTNMDAIEYRERSITKQADKSAKFLRSVVAPYVGRYNISKDLLQFLTTLLSSAAQVLMKQGIVQSCSINSVTRDPDVADKILINITIVVFVAGNYYEITLNVRSR